MVLRSSLTLVSDVFQYNNRRFSLPPGPEIAIATGEFLKESGCVIRQLGLGLLLPKVEVPGRHQDHLRLKRGTAEAAVRYMSAGGKFARNR